MDYPFQFHDKYTLKLAFDAFNIFNSQHRTGTNQNLDTAPGSPSVDYEKPLASSRRSTHAHRSGSSSKSSTRC